MGKSVSEIEEGKNDGDFVGCLEVTGALDFVGEADGDLVGENVGDVGERVGAEVGAMVERREGSVVG